MEKKTLKVLRTCTRRNFGLKIKHDPSHEQTYVLDIETKSSAAKLFFSAKATWKDIWLSYIVEITGHCIFSKSEDTTALAKIRDEGVTEFHIAFIIEPGLTAKQQQHNINELALFDLCTKL